MKVREFERLADTSLLSAPPASFRVSRTLLYDTPLGWVLRGFQANRSQWDRDEFYVETFAMPLYIPTEYVYYPTGRRLGGVGHAFSIKDDPAELIALLLSEGLPYLAAYATPEALMAIADQWIDRRNVRQVEFECYTRIIVGDLEHAPPLAEEVAAWEVAYDWMQHVVDRGRLIAELLATDPSAALEQLRVWRAGTIAALKLRDD